MNTATRVTGFLLALAATFALALGAGMVFGPTPDAASSADAATHGSHRGDDGDGDGASARQPENDAAAIPGGLMISQHGYTLALDNPRADAGKNVPVTFTVTGPDGRPVTSYDVEHEKQLHLIAVRRDFTGFQHVHPELSDDGVWSTRLDLTPGSWRVFADFKATDGDPLTLGADLTVAGDYRPLTLAGESRTAVVGDYTVTLDGEVAAGTDAKLTVSVTRNGKPVTDLQPYLGAYGHLVALRGGDLAYLHVHPDGTPGDGSTQPGPDVVFYAAVPSPGTYHLYLDFKHEGVVRTAPFTVTTTGQAAPAAQTPMPHTTSDAPDSGNAGHGGHDGH